MKSPDARPAVLREMRRNLPAYLFTAPFFLLFAVFFVYPTLRSIYLSLFKWKTFGTYSFVGLDNYVKLFHDPLFLKSIWNTAFVVITSSPAQIVLALVLAVALNAKFVKGRTVWRAVFFSPILISSVVTAIVWTLMFDLHYGFINYLLSLVHLGPVPWLTQGSWARVAVSTLVTWRWTGWNMVIILAGLQSIPQELYEAAEVDGASSWQTFWHVTLPLLRPVLTFCLMISLIDNFKLFAEPAMLTDGGPSDGTLSIVMYLYRQAFKYHNFGYASAVAVGLFAIIVVISLVSYRLTRQED